jgi:ribonuclease R
MDGDFKLDIESLIYKFGVETEFNPTVIGRLDALRNDPTPRDIEGRVDLRNELIFSIDGADARDLDDAISIEKLENGEYKLAVHIADVAHYVREKTPLGNQAYERGTSVYLPDRVIPMLPTKLSNGLCSLNPGVPRLAMTCEMILSENGVLKDYKIYESVIESKYRLTYDLVRDIIEDRDTLETEM